MYRGFNLEIDWDGKTYYDLGFHLVGIFRNRVESKLEDFLNDDESLNGSKIQEDWFPQINAHVFISHSHKDKRLAIELAGWLFKQFGILTFIDSCVWGFANDLQKTIDNKYCRRDNGSYSYELRNKSTSHVHMMLSTALSRLIDKTECLFFLNTPQSISTSEVIKRTASPWLYSEISISQILRRQIPERRRIQESKYFSKAETFDAELKVKYDLDLSHLTYLTLDSLIDWEKRKNRNPNNSLDELYKLYPVRHSGLIKG